MTRSNLSAVQAALGTNVVVRRAKLRLSQVELAECSGVHRATISAIESGEGRATLDVLAKLAAALKVRVDKLLVPVPVVDRPDAAELARRAETPVEEFTDARDLLAAVEDSLRYSPRGRRSAAVARRATPNGRRKRRTTAA